MITDFVTSTILYMETNLQAPAIGAIVTIALIVLAVFGLVLLVFRSVRLWYWKINDQMKALEKIDQSLEEIKQTLPDSSVAAAASPNLTTTEVGSVAMMDIELLETGDKDIQGSYILNSKAEDTREDTETNRNKLQAETPKIVFDKQDKDERALTKSGYNIGKTGKIYAEETLREQIQF